LNGTVSLVTPLNQGVALSPHETDREKIMISISANNGVAAFSPSPATAAAPQLTISHTFPERAPYQESSRQTGLDILSKHSPLMFEVGYSIPVAPFLNVGVKITRTCYGQTFVHLDTTAGPSVGPPVSTCVVWPTGKRPGPDTVRGNQVGIGASIHAKAIVGVSHSTSSSRPVFTVSPGVGAGVSASVGFEISGGKGKTPHKS
jgi:hypothetical protein